MQLTGKVVAANRDQSPVKFVLRDFSSPRTVTVAYSGSVPDAFRVGRSVIITGRLGAGGVFRGKPDTPADQMPEQVLGSERLERRLIS